MTKQEIKDLIAAKIAGQGNQVDIGGVLADILNALADGGSTPIRLTATLVEGDTLQDLIEAGLTKEEIEAAARGERTGVVIGREFYQIARAYYDVNEWQIAFYSIKYGNDGSIEEMLGSFVLIDGDIVSITNAEI